MTVSKSTLQLRLGGLVAIHAARAAQTALGGIPQILTATVTLGGGEIEVARPFDLALLEHEIRSALTAVDVTLIELTVLQERMLPLA